MMNGMTGDPASPTTDGRRLRRERGRHAAIDAMIDLVFEGHCPPGPELIAERAGVSIATLFRYFETLDELRRETTHRYFERYADTFEVAEIGEGPLAVRIKHFVDSRVAGHEATAPMARLARIRAAEIVELNETVDRIRATRADQIRHHFDEDLRAMSNAAADDVVAVIASLTSFEAWDQMRHHHDRSQAQCRRAWTLALTSLLTPNP